MRVTVGESNYDVPLVRGVFCFALFFVVVVVVVVVVAVTL